MKKYSNAKISEEQMNNFENISNDKQSKVGKKLSELTTKRVIILVLLLILVIPLFSSDYYYSTNRSFYLWLKILKKMAKNYPTEKDIIKTTYDKFIEIHKNNDAKLVYCRIPIINATYNNNDKNLLRAQEKLIYSDNEDGTGIYGILSLRIQAKQNAGINIARTIFVCIILTFGAMTFSKDANDLILRPIERMIEKVIMFSTF